MGDATRALLSERDELLARLLELRQQHAPAGEALWPDANGTLRLTAGHVEGYAAADAVAAAEEAERMEGLAEEAEAAMDACIAQHLIDFPDSELADDGGDDA